MSFPVPMEAAHNARRRTTLPPIHRTRQAHPRPQPRSTDVQGLGWVAYPRERPPECRDSILVSEVMSLRGSQCASTTSTRLTESTEALIAAIRDEL